MKKLILLLLTIMCLSFTLVACSPVDGSSTIGPNDEGGEVFVENKEIVAMVYNEAVDMICDFEFWDKELSVIEPIKGVLNGLTNLDKSVVFGVDKYEYVNGQEQFKGTQNVDLSSAQNELVFNSLLSSMQNSNFMLKQSVDGFVILNQLGDGVVEYVDVLSFSDLFKGDESGLGVLPLGDIELVLSQMPELAQSDIEFDSTTNYHTIKNSYLKNSVDCLVDYAFANGKLAIITDSGLTPAQTKLVFKAMLDELGLSVQYKLSNLGNILTKISIAPTSNFSNTVNDMLSDLHVDLSISKFNFEFAIGHEMGVDVQEVFVEYVGVSSGKEFSFKYDSDYSDKDGIIDSDSTIEFNIENLNVDLTFKEDVDIYQITKSYIDGMIELYDTQMTIDADLVESLDDRDIYCKLDLVKEVADLVIDGGDTFDFSNIVVSAVLNAEEDFFNNNTIANVSLSVNNLLVAPRLDNKTIEYYDKQISVDFEGDSKAGIENKDNSKITKLDIVETIDYYTKNNSGSLIDEDGFYYDQKFELSLVDGLVQDIDSSYAQKVSSDLLQNIISDDDTLGVNAYKHEKALEMLSKAVEENVNTYVDLENNKYIICSTQVNQSGAKFAVLVYCYAESVEKLTDLGFVEYVKQLPEDDSVVTDKDESGNSSIVDFPEGWFDDIEKKHYNVYFEDGVHTENTKVITMRVGEKINISMLDCMCEGFGYDEETDRLGLVHRFLGWSYNGQLITSNMSIAFDEDVHLVAQWYVCDKIIDAEVDDFDTGWLN